MSAGWAGGAGSVTRASIGVRAAIRSLGEASPAQGKLPAVASWAVQRRTLELQQKGFGEKAAHLRRIQPVGGAGISDIGDGTAHAKLAVPLAELWREGKRPPQPAPGRGALTVSSSAAAVRRRGRSANSRSCRAFWWVRPSVRSGSAEPSRPATGSRQHVGRRARNPRTASSSSYRKIAIRRVILGQ